MNDIIFIANPTYGPAIWLPVAGWIPVNSPIVGSFLAIVVSVVIAIITIMRTSDSNRRYIETVWKNPKGILQQWKEHQRIKLMTRDIGKTQKEYNY